MKEFLANTVRICDHIEKYHDDIPELSLVQETLSFILAQWGMHYYLLCTIDELSYLMAEQIIEDIRDGAPEDEKTESSLFSRSEWQYITKTHDEPYPLCFDDYDDMMLTSVWDDSEVPDAEKPTWQTFPSPIVKKSWREMLLRIHHESGYHYVNPDAILDKFRAERAKLVYPFCYL